MKRRWLRFVVLLGALLGLCVVAWLSIALVPGPYDQIQPGMTLKEVQSLLGPRRLAAGSLRGSLGFWETEEGTITVRFKVDWPTNEDSKLSGFPGFVVTKKSIDRTSATSWFKKVYAKLQKALGL